MMKNSKVKKARDDIRREPLEFNPDVHPELPSFSPRENMEYKSDKSTAKQNENYLETHQELTKVMNAIQTELLIEKPENVLDYICDSFFSIENMKKWRDMIKNK